MTVPRIIDRHGRPMARLSAGASAYEAASTNQADLAAWMPWAASAQGAIGLDRDVISARVHDIARNDGWASASMDRLVDSVIGGGWRLSAKPNARSLGIDPDVAHALADEIESEWTDYVNDPGFLCDVGRRMHVGMLLALAFRHRMLDGEALGVLYWLERGGDYATSLSIVDPDRLSNPMDRMDTETLRSGVEMDGNGAPIAYHIRARHPGDMLLSGGGTMKWERVPRETEWGRPVVVHAFEPQRSGQVRGVSVLSPVLRKLKQVTNFDKYELEAAGLNAVMAAIVESPMDHEALAESLEGGGLTDYQNARLGYHTSAKPMRFPGVKVGFLYPNESVKFLKPEHPNANFEAFVRAALRNVASAAGLSYEQLTMDWSQVNYSSARAALLEVWRGLTSRKNNFAAQFMRPFYAAWLEEAIDRGRIRLPRGAPAFWDRRAAYCRAEWIGPGRGWIDPMKEADAAVTRVDGTMSTLERECAEQGLDYREVIQQRAREAREMSTAGLDPAQPLRATQTRQQSTATSEESA